MRVPMAPPATLVASSIIGVESLLLGLGALSWAVRVVTPDWNAWEDAPNIGAGTSALIALTMFAVAAVGVVAALALGWGRASGWWLCLIMAFLIGLFIYLDGALIGNRIPWTRVIGEPVLLVVLLLWPSTRRHVWAEPVMLPVAT